MKLIHTADIHLGSPFSETKGQASPSIRRAELLEQFKKLVDYAKNNGVEGVLLSGDIFDNDSPSDVQKQSFYRAIEKYPDITFFYLRGNHDNHNLVNVNKPQNLLTFGDDWMTYDFHGIKISGVELTKRNYRSIYDNLKLDPSYFNIVMLHGTPGSQMGVQDIMLSALKNKHINYLALGHVHIPSEGKLDGDGIYVMPGCLEGRGFDETGPRGFYLLNIEGNDLIKHHFIPFSRHQYFRENIDVTGCKDISEIEDRIEKLGINENNFYELALTGTLSFSPEDLLTTIEQDFKGRTGSFTIKDNTTEEIDVEELKRSKDFKGELTRTIYNDTTLSDEDKKRVLDLCLKAMERRQ